MTVCFPTAIQQIDLDATANWITTVDPNCSVAEIRACFAVSRTKLNNIDLVTGGGSEVFAEISSEPSSLELELRWNPRRDEQRAFTNTIAVAQLCVTIGKQRHASRL